MREYVLIFVVAMSVTYLLAVVARELAMNGASEKPEFATAADHV